MTGPLERRAEKGMPNAAAVVYNIHSWDSAAPPWRWIDRACHHREASGHASKSFFARTLTVAIAVLFIAIVASVVRYRSVTQSILARSSRTCEARYIWSECLLTRVRASA